MQDNLDYQRKKVPVSAFRSPKGLKRKSSEKFLASEFNSTNYEDMVPEIRMHESKEFNMTKFFVDDGDDFKESNEGKLLR
jgi:hypothetical protein